MRGMIGGVVLLLVVGAALAAYGLGLFPPDPPAQEVERISPAAASSAEMKLAQLGNDGVETRLTAEELTSLFRYRPEIWSLGILRQPTVFIAGDTIRIDGRVAAADLPALPELEPIRNFLPDTAGVVVSGNIRPLDASTTVLQVGGIEVAGMPIPFRFFAPLLERLGQDPQNGLPEGMFVLPLPPGIASVRTEGGDLVLTP